MRHHQTSGMIVTSLVVATFCCRFVLASSYVSADDSYNADVTLSVPVACTMTGTINTPHTANVESGTYVADIGTTTLKAVCNDANGFSIYAIGYSNQEYGNNKMLAMVGGTLAPTYDITTGTAQNGNTSNWAMKLNAVAGTYAPTILSDFDSYHAVPDTYTKVATRTAGTDATVGANLQSTYAVYVTSTQPAGSYNGKVKYTMVYPNDADTPLQPQTTQAGQICYYPNGSNVEGTMGCQTIPASGGSSSTIRPTSATLLASNFSREGHGFAGWSKTFDYSDDTGFLGPQEYIEFTKGAYSGDNNGLSLYAHWIKTAGSLQGWTGCSSLQSGAVTALTDQRDNETYAVAKLSDGKCWMIENLRLENTAVHNTDGSLAQGYNASFAGLADPEAPWANDSTTANSLYSTDGSTDKTISGSYPGYRFPRYNNVNTPTTATDRPSNPTSNSATNSTTNAGMYSYGNYYTWAAAIADTTDYSSGNRNTTSICPTGWHIPTGGGAGEFYALNAAVNSGATDATANNGFRAYPNNFIYSGGVGSSSSVNSRGSFGYYWSSTVYSSYNAYNMYFGDDLNFGSSFHPGTSGTGMYFGRSIRCLAPGA